MPLTTLAVPCDHPDWLFEVKYDGFRALAYLEDARAPGGEGVIAQGIRMADARTQRHQDFLDRRAFEGVIAQGIRMAGDPGNPDAAACERPGEPSRIGFNGTGLMAANPRLAVDSVTAFAI